MTVTYFENTNTHTEWHFQLTGVTMTEHDPETSRKVETSKTLATLLEEYPLRVSYQDGNIEQICLSAPEPVQVLNIKRGILSVFQNSMDDISKSQTVSEVRTSFINRQRLYAICYERANLNCTSYKCISNFSKRYSTLF